MLFQGCHDRLVEISVFVIPQALFHSMKEQILAQHGHESCGFVAGRLDGQEAQVEQVFFISNLSELPDHFVISPREHRQVEEVAKERDQELIGLFHSHQGDPQPSPKDRENMDFYPLVWLILGGTERGKLEEIRSLAFKPTRDGPEQISIHIS